MKADTGALGHEKRTPKTKEALADALIAQLAAGTPLSKIKVKQITDACNVDRQTFYYYFKNIPELAQFVYERELEQAFGHQSAEGMRELGWKERLGQMLGWLDANPALREMIVPSLGDKALREEIWKLVHGEVLEELLPQLLDAGLDESSARERCRYVAHMLESALMGWLNGEIVANPVHVLDCIEEMLGDYLFGLRLRLEGERG